ncbi:MAG: hypothetical protein IPO43_00800 [Rhodoferax sp.]|nr:hypothetical protein [Rhodoferax sp.]
MDKYSVLLGSASALVVGMVLGAMIYAWRQRAINVSRRRIPKQWPLAYRSIVNSRERKVWRWLVRSFLDHQVMVKMPITRFTVPASKEGVQHWFEVLRGVYCSFTVCTAEGKVIGCVDVPSQAGLSLSNQTLKHTLLSQCNIRYWVIDADQLPGVGDIRVAFLGDQAHMNHGKEYLDSEFNQTKANLQAAVMRQRHGKNVDADKLEAKISDVQDSFDSQLSSGWQPNSFVVPLDSRVAELR